MKFSEDAYSERPFKEKLAWLRANRALTQTELAKAVGISQRQIAAYESGESKPRTGTLMKLAEALKVSSIWLGGDLMGIEILSIPKDAEIRKEVPLIKQESVIHWLKHRDQIELVEEYIPTTQKFGSGAFALKINEPAMSSISKEGFAFPAGSIVVFDISKRPIIDGDFVLAVINHKATIFRQIFIGAIECNLVSLDSRYPIEKITTESIEKHHNLAIPAVQVIFNLPASERKKAP